MQNSIIVGAIELTAVERTVDRVLVEGWALPGQRFTSDHNFALAEATRLNKGVQEYQGAHCGQ